MSSRHTGALTWLLILAGDVELNPGPVDFTQLSKETIENALKYLHQDEADYSVSGSKAELITLLEHEKAHLAELAVMAVLGFQPQPTAASNSAASEQTLNLQSFAAQARSNSKPIEFPKFCESMARQWFDHISQILENASDTVRSKSLLIALPTNVLHESGVESLNDFDAIKQRIIKHFDETNTQRLRKLLEHTQLGADKPSTALRKMQKLAPGQDDVIRLRFFECLPSQIRIALAGLPDNTPLDSLAETADKMAEVLTPDAKIQQVSQGDQAGSSSANSETQSLKDQIAQLSQAVQAIRADFTNFRRDATQYRRDRSQSRGRPQSRGNGQFGEGRQRSRSPSQGARFNPKGRLCYYHFRFGSNANKCKPGCKWTDSGNSRPPTPPRQESGE